MDEYTQSANINEKWLENIYENIKKLEEHERLAREGCINLFEYVQMTHQQREINMGDVQYKNLRFFITEFNLLLSDLTPILDDEKTDYFRLTLNRVEDMMENKNAYVKYLYNSSRKLIKTKATNSIEITLRLLSSLKVELFKEIKNILYIKSSQGW